MDLALTNARNGTVLIDRGLIADVGNVAAPPGTKIIDCSGRTIAPGFRNSHVHFFERKWADAASIPKDDLARQLEDAFLRFGFTTVFDLGSTLENTQKIRERIESGEVAGPRILTTGEGLIPVGGNPPDIVLHMMGVMKTALPEVANAQQAADAAKSLLDRGADGIKLFASVPRGASLTEEIMAAAVNEAHRAGKPVFVHPGTFADVQNALRAGVDVIAHTTPSSAWNAIDPRKAALTPTLALWKNAMRHDRVSTQERFTKTAIDQLRMWRDAGGKVLFGTDLGAVDYDPVVEYELMSEAGMSVENILESLTDSNRIEKGKPADLIVFNELTGVQLTLRDGRVLFDANRVDFAPSRSTP